MEELYNLLLKIIANSPEGSQLGNLDTLDGSEGFLVFKPGEKRPYLIQKDKITFPGEPATTFLSLSDTEDTYTGQEEKILFVKTGGGIGFKTIAEVSGITKDAIISALNYTPLKGVSVNGGTAKLADQDGIANIEVSEGVTTSPTELISITTNWQQGTLDYKPYAEWRNNGVLKSFSGDRTADPADPTHARYDLWYIDLTTETVEIKKGTASANPERPSVDDPVNHLDTGIFIHILAGATTPEGVNGEVVYAENAPGEYAITAPGSVNVASTDTPHSGSVNIEVIDGQFLNQSQSIVFTPSAPLTPEGKELAYWIKNKTGGIHHWTFVGPSVKNGRTTSVVIASPGNYDANSTAWQAQSIPFPTDLTEITSFRLVADFTGFSFHLDDITIISGGGVVVIGGDYADKRLSNIASDLSEAEKTAIKTKLGISSGGSAPVAYATMADMYAAQANQVANGSYRVDNASAHPDVNAGRAWFDYKGTTVGDHTDYILRSEEESMNLDAQLANLQNQITDNANAITGHGTRLTALEAVKYNTIIPKSANFIIEASQHRALIRVNSASDVIVTIPEGLPLGFECTVKQAGAGRVLFVAATNVTLEIDATEVAEIASRYNAAMISKEAADATIDYVAVYGGLKKAA